MTKEYHRKIGKITDFTIGINFDRDLISWDLCFDFKSGGVQALGYQIEEYDKEIEEKVVSLAYTELFADIVRLLDVRELSQAKGKYLYALYESDGWGELIVGVQRLEPDGDERVLLADWRHKWWPESWDANGKWIGK